MTHFKKYFHEIKLNNIAKSLKIKYAYKLIRILPTLIMPV